MLLFSLTTSSVVQINPLKCIISICHVDSIVIPVSYMAKAGTDYFPGDVVEKKNSGGDWRGQAGEKVLI